MSHTITDCPRCHKDFMYHSSDVHLHRVVDLEFEDGELSEEVICQDCDEKERKPKEVVKRPRTEIWINLYVLSLYVTWEPTLIVVLRLIMFAPKSGVITFKFSLWGNQQLSFGINKFILLWLYDSWTKMKRKLARIKR